MNSAKTGEEEPRLGRKHTADKNFDRHCLNSQLRQLKIQHKVNRDTLEVVYEEEECFEDENEDAFLITDHQSQASISKSSSSEVAVQEWETLEHDISNCQALLTKLASKHSDCTAEIHLVSSEGIQIYPLAGAFLGSCLGGPVGFLAGVKIGGLAAVGGGILGKPIFVYLKYFPVSLKLSAKLDKSRVLRYMLHSALKEVV